MAELGKNVFYIRQRIKNITGKLVVANKRALFEIRCKQGQLVKATKGLAIFIISDDCSFAISGQIIIQSENVAGFPPNFLFGLNKTLSKNRYNHMDWHKFGNSIASAMIGVIMAICCVIICVRCSFTQTEIQYNYVAPAEIELEDLESDRGIITKGGGKIDNNSLEKGGVMNLNMELC